MNRFFSTFVVVFLLVAVVRSVQSEEPSSLVLKDPVAVVNGAAISKADLEQTFGAILATQGVPAEMLGDDQRLEGLHRILDDMILDLLLEERAKDIEVPDSEVDEALNEVRSQFSEPGEFEQALAGSGETMESLKEEIRSNFRKRSWIESRLAELPDLDSAAAKKYYDENPDRFDAPETVRASHILIGVDADATPETVLEKEQLAKEVRKKIAEGADFAELAVEYSDDPGSKARGGDLDFFSKDRMVEEFADASFALQVGEISDLVRTQFGWHIIKVTDRSDPRKIPFDEVEPRVTEFLGERQRRETVSTLLDALRQQSEVTVNLPPLKTEE